MYHIAVRWNVQPEHIDDFIAAAQKDGRESGAAEEGTLRFELIADESDPNIYYLNEGYADKAAFDRHAEGAYFKAFFAEVERYSEMTDWLIKGTTVEDRSA
ncbi:MAG TPA: putative quinol monooxygenase [Solirubrobacterales bacterium]